MSPCTCRSRVVERPCLVFAGRILILLLSALLLFGTTCDCRAQGAGSGPQQTTSSTDSGESLCLMVEAAARANALPLDFFARIIWQESRFQPQAVGPATRTGERAQGIAQFMPGTAGERGLLDPFNPVEALPKSAAFLAELQHQFGNLGLAAAAYNAGPQRVRDFLTGTRALPAETRRYVLSVTGRSVDDWRHPAEVSAKSESNPQASREPSTCRDLMALLKQAPNTFVDGLQQHIERVAASPWGVQLSAGFSRDQVLAAYAEIGRHFAEILAGRDPSIFSTVLRSRGTHPFYQVRIGASTRAEADSLCARISRAGGACLVLRNPSNTG